MLTIRGAVVFAILMENNSGIQGKHPAYLLEKLKSCQSLSVPEVLLDSQNLLKFLSYKNKYGFNWKPQRDYILVPKGYFDPVTGSATKEGLKMAGQKEDSEK